MIYIDTTSKKTMEISLAKYLNISVDELYQYIKCAADKAQSDDRLTFQQVVFFDKLNDIFSKILPENRIDHIMLFHLSRRLQNDFVGKNLRELLLGDSSLSAFFEEYGIRFFAENEHIAMKLHERYVSMNNEYDLDTEQGIRYLRWRLGYDVDEQDFCFNGFALHDSLLKNSYTREMYNGSEFLRVLADTFSLDEMKEDFCQRSEYYCFTYIIPISQIVFDGKENYDEDEKEFYLLDTICERLMMYMEGTTKYDRDDGNPILRLEDDATVPERYFINKEVITLDMIMNAIRVY